MAKHIFNVHKSVKPVESMFKYTNTLGHFHIFGDKLPGYIDLRSMCSPIVDQGTLGSCSGNAIASGLREFLEVKTGKYTPEDVIRLSRLFVYYEERLREGTVNQDAGADLSDGMKVILTMGVAPEVDDPYIIDTFKNPPSLKAIRDALNWRVASIHALSDSNELKHCLASGYPIVIGIEVFDSFEDEQVAQNGIVPMPNTKTEQNLGGHAVMLVGYNDQKQWFIVRNSWGTNWGDHGYFYLPYEYAAQYAWDFWTAR